MKEIQYRELCQKALELYVLGLVVCIPLNLIIGKFGNTSPRLVQINTLPVAVQEVIRKEEEQASKQRTEQRK